VLAEGTAVSIPQKRDKNDILFVIVVEEDSFFLGDEECLARKKEL